MTGLVEPWPANDVAEIIVVMPSTCSPDGFENDDSSSFANELLVGEISTRNLCGVQDPDWVSVNIEAANYYQFNAFSINGGAATRLTLFAEDGVTIVSTGEARITSYNVCYTKLLRYYL